MRYPLAANLATLIHSSLFKDKQFDHTFQQLIKTDKRMGSKDRKLLAEAGYSILRSAIKLSAIAPKGSDDKLKAWNLIAIWYFEKYGEWPKWDTISSQPEFQYDSPLEAWQELSIAKELYQEIEQKFGPEKSAEIIQIMDEEGPVWIRTNRIRTSPEQLAESLNEQGVELHTIKEYPDAFQLVERKQLLNFKQYKEGWFEIQDIGSQEIAQFIQIQQGESLLDACAGSGGKSLAVASYLNNTVRIVAHDVNEERLLNAKDRVKRSNAKIELVHSQALFDSGWTFDHVLIDAPCTGSGTLKRKPQMKWDFTEEYLNSCIKEQWLCLIEYQKVLKPGGKLVYATCSVLEKENQLQVEKFLSEFPDFELVEEKQVLPSKLSDGFYMAKLMKNK